MLVVTEIPMSRTTVFALLLIVLNANLNVLPASAKQRPIVLESSNNDVILVPKGQTPVEKIKPLTGQQVTICLQNSVPGSRAKAFDISKTDHPRFIAQSGKQICATFVPTRHKIHFWKTNKQGKLTLTLARSIDLGDTDGTQINLTWVRD